MDGQKELNSQGLTWDSRKTIPNPDLLMDRMRSSGLPLFEGDGSDTGNESDNNKITVLVAVEGERLSAIVATPSGLIYRFEPNIFEKDWWSFAARYYYVVTGNMTDRQILADRSGVDFSAVKGRTCSRKKSEQPSCFTLDQLLEQACPPIRHKQESLFI